MRRPWELAAGAPDDVESLQTDVMRFVAILGLCLTAIFSLVNATQHARAPGSGEAVAAQVEVEPDEPQEPEEPDGASAQTSSGVHLPRPEPGPEREPQTIARPQPVPASASSPAAAPDGFSLEFASAGALEGLRERGDVVVYAIAADQYWQLDDAGRGRPVTPPASYHRMHADTLPRAILSAVSSLPAGEEVTWAITLPPRVTRSIAQLMSGAAGGVLVIEVDGSVALEP